MLHKNEINLYFKFKLNSGYILTIYFIISICKINILYYFFSIVLFLTGKKIYLSLVPSEQSRITFKVIIDMNFPSNSKIARDTNKVLKFIRKKKI